VSVDSDGSEGDGDSFNPSISADGRFVAFHSVATNLVAGDTNAGSDVFVHDRLTGTTERVSVDSSGAQSSGQSSFPSISASGRFVAFASTSTDLVPDDNNSQNDVFVHDRQTGTTERVSVDSAGTEGNSLSFFPSISADGRFVSFASSASNLVGSDNNGSQDVFLRDRQTDTTERVSVSSGGSEGNAFSVRQTISADGRFVVFQSAATNLVGDDNNGADDAFVHDRLTGLTMRVSVDSAGGEATGGHSEYPSISADGRFVAFESGATNLVAGDDNAVADVFVHDRRLGVTERVSVSSGGGQATDVSGTASISANGRFVSFFSSAANLVSGDANAESDIFLRDRGLLPDGRNDVAVDFGGAGLWQRLNDTAWQKIHNVSPQRLVSGDLDGSLQDEVIVTFGAAGLWARYDNATWKKLHNVSPAIFVTGDLDGNGSDELAVDFGAPGLWIYWNNATWSKLHAASPNRLGAGDLDGDGKDELIVDFGSAGVWSWAQGKGWKPHALLPGKQFTTGDLDGNGADELIADFGSFGMWVLWNNLNWSKIHNSTAEGLVTGDLDGNDQEELIVDLGAAGLWVRYNNATWVKRHNASPKRMLATDVDGGGKTDLVVDFGGAGLWVKRNNGPWSKIHNATTQDLAAGGVD
jgi:Tol biopolymer transport system component